ncbi:hypothetical protein GQ457_13G020790 [Hibiscus cannabinus]
MSPKPGLRPLSVSENLPFVRSSPPCRVSDRFRDISPFVFVRFRLRADLESEGLDSKRISITVILGHPDLDHRLEEKFKAAEGSDARELSLVPNLVLPMKFKMPEFEKFDGTSSPSVHLTMFCRRMTGRVDNDELLIHCFQDSLKGSAARWYNQLTRDKIRSWKDLAKAFIEQYKHITDIEPDRITLQNMEMKPNESFRQYVQRWRDVAAHVQPPLLEKEIAPTFVRTLKEPFLNYMLGNANKNFEDLLTKANLAESVRRLFIVVRASLENLKRLTVCPFPAVFGVPFHRDLSFNHSFVVLIPKTKAPTSMTDYRPISLVGSMYKLLTKVLANRFKGVTKETISDSQFAFCPGKQILDCSLIVNEVIDYVKKKRYARGCIQSGLPESI